MAKSKARAKAKQRRRPDFLDDLFATDFEELLSYLPAESESGEPMPTGFSAEDVRFARTMGIVLA